VEKFGPGTVTPYPQKITFAEMRASGIRNMLIYCRDVAATTSGSTPMDANWAR